MSDHDEGPLCAEPAEEPVSPSPPSPSSPSSPEDDADYVPARVGCRSRLRGWAGAHLHGAVRPRRRVVGRGRPPGRWC